jgi:hypothetical protein
VPTAYLFCEEEDLAAALVLLHRLPRRKRTEVIKSLANVAS